MYVYISYMEKNIKNDGNQNFGADFCIAFSFDFEPVFILRRFSGPKNDTKRQKTTKIGSKSKEKTMQKSAPKFWLPSFSDFSQV